jgi:hypothetical protein
MPQRSRRVFHGRGVSRFLALRFPNEVRLPSEGRDPASKPRVRVTRPSDTPGGCERGPSQHPGSQELAPPKNEELAVLI